MITEQDDYKTVGEHAKEVLDKVVDDTKSHGVRASGKVVFGGCWQELIRGVVQGSYDLVIAGTRQKGPFRGMFIGHTGNRLLRKCPCPDSITKPELAHNLRSILVAHDLSEVDKEALALGEALANSWEATLHVLHAIDLSACALVDALKVGEVKERTEKKLKELNKHDVVTKVSVISDSPGYATLDYVDSHKIELVVMGTVGRRGIRGAVVGNTAEKVMPLLPCSLLAIKPEGFQSPAMLRFGEFQSEFSWRSLPGCRSCQSRESHFMIGYKPAAHCPERTLDSPILNG